MDFITYISTETKFTESSPQTTPVRLTSGRLTGGFLYFPRGPSGYLHFIAKIATHQIAPFNVGQSYRLNGCVVPLHLDIDFFEPPFVIDCLTWNDSTTFPHVLTVGFFLDPFARPRTRKGLVKSLYNATLGYKKGGDRKT